jgi:predicted transcriptional regulator
MATTLHVRVEPHEAVEDRVAAKLRAIDEGQRAELDGDPVLSVPDEETLEAILSSKNLELIKTTATAEPKSLRALARLVERDIKNVSEAMGRLAELGLVDLETEGRAKRPRVPYDELEVTYPLRSEVADSEAIA